MGWVDRYLRPVTKRARIGHAIWKVIKEFFNLVPFALIPHAEVEDPKEDLPEIGGIDESVLKATEKIYDASLSRIENLEKKAFYLLSYITAIFTIIALLYAQFSNYPRKTFLFVPLAILFLSLIISFRCLRVKTTFQIFIDDIYRFNSENGPIKKAVELHLSYLKSAVYNEAKADNTADMLRAARLLIAIGVLSLFVVISAILIEGSDERKPTNEEIQLHAIADNIVILDSTLKATIQQCEQINKLVRKVDSLSLKMGQMSNELKKIKQSKPSRNLIPH